MIISATDESSIIDTIHNKNDDFNTYNVRQRPDWPKESAEDADVELASQQDEKPCGSLELGKHRRDDAPVVTEPEKHLSQRATSKEFYFPKSN
jgi:hypothetical protein